MSVSEALHCGSPGQPVLSGIFIAPLGLGLLRLILRSYFTRRVPLGKLCAVCNLPCQNSGSLQN